MACTKQFWIENIVNLFCSFDIIPMKDMTLEEQLNSLTRIVVLIFLLLFIIDYRHDFLFLAISLLLIIIIYYMIRSLKGQTCENYGAVDTVLQPFPHVPWNTNTNSFVFDQRTTSQNGCHALLDKPPRTYLEIPPMTNNPGLINTNDSLMWCAPEVPIEETVDANQRMVGPQNPKTLIQPVIPAPIFDYQTFAPNDFVVPTFLNDQRRQELFQNGYVESPSFEQNVREGFDYARYGYPQINTACGSNMNNLDYNLPINYRATACEKSPEMSEYNRNLFTIPLQPGLNTYSQVNQPDSSMSNMGISMTPSFLPTTFQSSRGGKDWDGIPNTAGQGLYVETDPALYNQQRPPVDLQQPTYPFRNEIYDPRYTGYGPNYRSYVDHLTGQPRFFYDDIDSQIQPNYITRNNIDFTQFGPQIGPATHLNHGYTNMQVREMANNTYTDSVIQQRTELQQRLMHKNSNREWQLRQMPISRQNQARAGGGKSGGGYAGPRG